MNSNKINPIPKQNISTTESRHTVSVYSVMSSIADFFMQNNNKSILISSNTEKNYEEERQSNGITQF